jgi:hypothetical protein
MAEITTKAEYANLSQRGLLGNFFKSYQTLEELEASGYQGFLTIRARDKQSKWFVPVTTPKPQSPGDPDIYSELYAIKTAGGPGPESFYFQQIPSPDTKRVANIEASYILGKFAAYIETDTMEPVRGIRERAPLYYDLEARMKLQSRLSAYSMDTLDELWAAYPGSIIEAVEFSAACGEFGKKLIVFEVRNF